LLLQFRWGIDASRQFDGHMTQAKPPHLVQLSPVCISFGISTGALAARPGSVAA
jgi:hypothetical protein